MLKHDSYEKITSLMNGETLASALEILSNSIGTERGYSVAVLLCSEKMIALLKAAFEFVVANSKRQKVT
jgi:hypothetical protein